MELRNRRIRSSLTDWCRFCGSCSLLEEYLAAMRAKLVQKLNGAAIALELSDATQQEKPDR
jgi:hypothetical protein